MSWPRWRQLARPGLWLVAVTLLSGLAPALAWAQAGWYVTPSLGTSEEYDDNVFRASSDRQWDVISRFTPGVKLGYRSAFFTLLGSGSIDAEVFANHPELTGVANRKHAGLEFSGIAERPQSFGINASYAETQTPSELQPLTNIELGRRTTTQYSVAPWLTHPFTDRFSGRADYSFTRTDSAGGFTTTTHQTGVGLSYLVTPLDTGRFTYRASVFQSENAATTISYTFTGGWTRRLSETTSGSIDAGVRITDGAVSPEVSASLQHAFKYVQVAGSYAHTQTTVVGQQGVVNTDSVSASASAQPLRRLSTTLGTSFSRTTNAANSSVADTTVWGANLGVSYTITRWLIARAAYRFYLEEGSRTIRGHIITIGLDFADTFRIY